MASNPVDISIVVPAYRAEKFIQENLQSLYDTLKKTRKSFEIICVVDGIVDTTFEKAKILEKKYPKIIRVFSYRRNRGKGYAVRFGLKEAQGELLGFIDAGGEIRPESINNLLRIQSEKDADIVVGSKWNPRSKTSYPIFRKVLSFGYLAFVKALFNIKISDTQAGIKIFNKKVVNKVLPYLEIDGYAFDIEFLSRAEKLGYKKIFEAPIIVEKGKENPESSMSPLSTFQATISMFWDTLLLRIRQTLQKS